MNLSIQTAIFTILFGIQTAFATAPNPTFTQGDTCTPENPDFSGYDYPTHVARCKRSVSKTDKSKIALIYKVPENEWKNYEFDHLIPLCAGGSNEKKNIWPQPLAEAHEKDFVENQVCIELRKGQITQAQAIERIWAWMIDHGAIAPPFNRSENRLSAELEKIADDDDDL